MLGETLTQRARRVVEAAMREARSEAVDRIELAAEMVVVLGGILDEVRLLRSPADELRIEPVDPEQFRRRNAAGRAGRAGILKRHS